MATWINDLLNSIVEGDSLTPQARTATTNGTGIDLLTSDGGASARVSSGAVSGTAPTLDVQLQESDDNVTFVNIVAGGGVFATITAAPASQRINFRRSKRYVRAVATIGGTTPSFTFGVVISGMKKAA